MDVTQECCGWFWTATGKYVEGHGRMRLAGHLLRHPMLVVDCY